ncbi:MAG TPA: hydroxypyruvate isomerase [Desulfitobacterium dehalogenans]|uniref:Hydroxypyruvate isomerase n=1 Tax=Desulfitobacterium dehalogenans TaxID=36854 RepID=A0A7C7D876_9FIRM|nr:hydroxypyruvate isomerase [Desulfitobacterium dehalogenans]
MVVKKDRLVANLSFLFSDLPMMERFNAARKAGLNRVEFMFPYDLDLTELKQELETHGLELVLFNLPAGDWGAGERGIALDPSRQEEFKAGVAKAIKIAQALHVKQINCLVGKIREDQSQGEQRATLISNIRYAADQLQQVGVKLLLEPLNHFDAPGFYLNTTEDVLKVIAEAGGENVFLQYDTYHAAREGEDLLKILQEKLPHIAHIQVADNPGRHQPGTGEIDYRAFFKTLTEAGYPYAVSMEYVPQPDTVASLEWIKAFE